MLSDISGATRDSSPAEVDEALAEVSRAFRVTRGLSGARRADLLDAIADEVRDATSELVEIAKGETGLSGGRLSGEVNQTATDLRMLAAWVRDDHHLDVVHDAPDPGYALGPRPDLRRYRLPVGVVLNFAASNFPFAFSVAGVDTASALAAGCPVVVKIHPGHLATSVATFRAIERAVAKHRELTDSPVTIIAGNDAGLQALRDPRVRVACFTGSLDGGRFLAGVAASRPDPIPFFGELGSINPVVITPGALAARGYELAKEYVADFTDSAGQVCVKSGLLLVPAGHQLASTVAGHVRAIPEHRMLYPGLGESYVRRREQIMSVPGSTVIAEGSVRHDDDGHVWASPTVVSVSLDDAIRHSSVIGEEAFGPISVMIEYTDVKEAIRRLPEWTGGSLTVSVHITDDEAELSPLIADLQHMAGRVIFNQWPGAVYITPAQHHGGPSPATTLDTPAATSVGQHSLGRFQRSVSWQNAPDAFLPADLRRAVADN